MKTLTKILPVAAALILILGSCTKNDQKTAWETYAEWRELNDNWINEKALETDAEGKPLYTRVSPVWNTNAYVLMRWFNDTTLTRDNLTPLYTSTVDVKYIGKIYNDEAFDSSYVSIDPADSVSRFQLSGTIAGWIIAMERMHVGDSVEIIVPYEQGYGSASIGTVILPYSALKFGIKLVDVAGEYIRPVN